jgi:hypothetical protein
MSGPLLIDEVIARGPSRRGGRIPKGVWQQLVHARINAQRFLFDEAASAVAGEFAIDCPDLVLGNRQFAIPPYDATYVELDSKAFFKSAKNKPSHLGPEDERVGYLVIGPYVYGLFARNGIAAVGFWRYQVMPPGQTAEQDSVTFEANVLKAQRTPEGVGPEVMRAFENNTAKLALMLGGALNLGGHAELDGHSTVWIHPEDMERYVTIASECSVQWIDNEHRMGRRLLPIQSAQGFYGDVRNFWALMLWLNQPTRVITVDVPAGRKVVKGKITPYLAHHVVTIKLGRVKTVRRLFTLASERKSPKSHDVKGHFRHRGGYRQCRGGEAHAWPLVPDDRGIWSCSRCGKERWHVKAHRRGDAGKGIVLKEYSVEAAE